VDERQREDHQEAGGGVHPNQVFLHGMQPTHFGVMDKPDGHAVIT